MGSETRRNEFSWILESVWAELELMIRDSLGHRLKLTGLQRSPAFKGSGQQKGPQGGKSEKKEKFVWQWLGEERL